MLYIGKRLRVFNWNLFEFLIVWYLIIKFMMLMLEIVGNMNRVANNDAKCYREWEVKNLLYFPN